MGARLGERQCLGEDLRALRRIARQHVRPRIGAIALQKLRPADLAGLYAALQRDGKGPGVGLAPRTVGHVHRVLHRALGHAMQWGIVQQNVASVVAPPRVDQEEVRIIPADRLGAVLRALKKRSIYPIASLALATGMRRGEILALRWRDVDLGRNQLRVEQALETTKQALRFKAPKTKYGRRTITLPSAIVDDLKTMRRAAQERNLALGLGKLQGDTLVFGKVEGGPRDPDGVTKEIRRAMTAIGAPKSPYTPFGTRTPRS